MRRKQARGTHRFHINLSQEQADKLNGLSDRFGWSYSVTVGRAIDELHARVDAAVVPVADTPAPS